MADASTRCAALRAELAPTRRLARLVYGVAIHVARCACELARGAAGTHAYDQYVAHCRRNHPDRPLPTREEFFRREFCEKWDGVRRCC